MITRWHFIRHAPVATIRPDGAVFYETNDEPADVSNIAAFRGLAEFLPRDAVWLTSPLQRAIQTADAIAAQGLTWAERLIEPRIAEQHYGDWHGMTRDQLAEALAERPRHKMWMTTAEDEPPSGESFCRLCERVAEAMQELTVRYQGRQIIAVAHGGTIRAAIAHALGIDFNKALAISVENLSTTRLDHVPGPGIGGDWRLVYTNRRPI